jgi:hypothetical protein
VRTPCQQIVIAGHREAAVKTLGSLIQTSATTPVELLHGISARNATHVAGKTIVTTDPDDVTVSKGLLRETSLAPDQICFLFLMCDLRDILIQRSDAIGGEFAAGFDHRLSTTAGIPTFADPGIVYIQTVMEAAVKRYANAMIIKQEDLVLRPDTVQISVSALTGLTFTDLFSTLLANDPAIQFHPGRFSAVGNASLDHEEAERIVRQFHLAPAMFDTLARHGYDTEGEREWYDSLVERAPEGLFDEPGLIVGFYTAGTRYEDEAARMAQSISLLELPKHLEEIPPEGSWLAAVRRKPAVLLDLRRRLRGPLLYVDVDAVVHTDPWPYLRGYQGDVAVAGHKAQAIISGTILLADTPGAILFLEHWIAAQDKDPTAWDQHALQQVVLADGPHPWRIQYLPPEMCRVFDRRYNPPVEAVIEHLQASREENASSNSILPNPNLESRRARLNDLDQLLNQTNADAPFSTLPADVRHAQTLRHLEKRTTDIQRWASGSNLKDEWSLRAQIVGALIDPGEKVLDLGCGAMALEQALPSGAIYLPADVVSRDGRTLFCDLNAGEVPNVDADVVTMLGVLEYCHDPLSVFAMLANCFGKLIVTYNAADLDAGRDRRRHGWFNDMPSATLVDYARQAGWHLETIVPHGERERIYVFRIRYGETK